MAVLAGVYFCAGKAGLRLATVHPSATAVWPAAGIALGALLVFGARLWPGVFVGAFLVNATTAGSPLTALAIATGNTLEALVGCQLVNRFARGRAAFERVPDLFRFILYAGTLGPALSATIGASTLCQAGLAEWRAYAVIWRTWWLGNVVGDIVLVPLVAARSDRSEPWRLRRALEVLGLALSALLVAAIVFGGIVPVGSLCLPPLLWAAYRFDARAVAATVVTFAVASLVGGSLVGPIFPRRFGDPLLLQQVFLGVICMSSLALAADVAARRRVEEQLRRAHDELEERVAERTEELRTANEALRLEVAERERVEEALRAAHETVLSANLELQRAAREADEANRMKSEFLANMSHELRTPLTSVLGFAELLRGGKVSPVSPTQAEFLDEILMSGRRLLLQINSILDLAKVEAGRMEFLAVPVDLAPVVYEALNAQRPMTLEKRISVGTEIQAGLTTVMADPERLRQVLDNYLSNAFKFTGDGGRVTVRVAQDGTTAFRIEVEDTGIGIKAEDGPRLFTQFRQLETGLSRKYPGTGLGLALTKKLVEAQGGHVGYRSTPGEGSVFYATLPIQAGAPAPAMQGGVTSPPTAACRILVVAGDPREREWLAAILSNAGCEVDAAASGATALVQCAQRAFDAIIVDLRLPDLSGAEVLDRIRAEGLNRDVPVLLVSAVAEPEISKTLGVQGQLIRPVAEEDVIAQLEQTGVRLGTPVLVIDDDPQDLKLMSYVLREMGYRPIARSDVASGLDAAQKTRPGAVVLDLMMPGLDGFDFLRRFQTTVGPLKAPVLAWTNKDLTEDERDTLRQTARAVILKARGSEKLREELRRHLPTSREATVARES